MEKQGALSGIKVLDMGRVQAGPLSAAILGDFGAEVLKLEIPETGDSSRQTLPEGGYFAAFNRSKKGITLDLKKGREVFLRLVKDVDVLIENFRPGVMDGMGLGYDDLKEINPGLIYLAISGFGQEGPYSMRAGFDPVAQGMSGIMSVTGAQDGRAVRCGAAVCDSMAGMNGALGVLAALQARNRTGMGQKIDVALVDVGVAAMSSVNQVYLSDGIVPARRGNGYAAAAPGGCYRASDGEVILASIGSDKGWKILCELMGRMDLWDHPDYRDKRSRVKNSAALDEIIEAWSMTKTTSELTDMFLKKKMVVGPVFTVDQVVHDPHIAGVRDMFTTVNLEGFGEIKITNQCIKMSGTPAQVTDPPALGQHNHEVYASLGYTEEEISSMRANGVI